MTLLDILKGISVPDQLGIYEESDAFTASTEKDVSDHWKHSSNSAASITMDFARLAGEWN
jgi:hypothetical protein